MIQMDKLSVLTLTSLILAMVFTVIAIAGFFFLIYRKGNVKNSVGQVMVLFIFPMLSFMMWTLSGLSITDTFSKNEALAIIISMVVGIAVDLTVFFVVKMAIASADKKKCIVKAESKEDLCEELLQVEDDLMNLKEIINDVIEEPKEKKVEEKKEAKTEVAKKASAKKVEVKEEKKEVKAAPKAKEEKKETKTETKKVEVKKEATEKKEVKEIKVEAKEVKETKVEKPVEEKKIEIKPIVENKEVKIEPAFAEEKPVEEKKPEPKPVVIVEKQPEVIVEKQPEAIAPTTAKKEVKIEIKQSKVEVKNAPVEEVKPVEEKKEVKVEAKKTTDDNRESDFIKSLNEILGELENNDNE